MLETQTQTTCLSQICFDALWHDNCLFPSGS
jgi:hypothetical protein